MRFIKAVSPAQAIDEWTPNFWHDIIGHLAFDEARNAVIAVKHSQTFVDPSDIIREAERAQHKHAHPSERTVREAIEASTMRELAAGPASPPNADYLRAKQELLDKNAARDAAAMSAGKPQHPPVPGEARHRAYAVACSWCGARPGARCSNTLLGTPQLMPHAARGAAGARAAGREPARLLPLRGQRPLGRQLPAARTASRQGRARTALRPGHGTVPRRGNHAAREKARNRDGKRALETTTERDGKMRDECPGCEAASATRAQLAHAYRDGALQVPDELGMYL